MSTMLCNTTSCAQGRLANTSFRKTTVSDMSLGKSVLIDFVLTFVYCGFPTAEGKTVSCKRTGIQLNLI